MRGSTTQNADEVMRNYLKEKGSGEAAWMHWCFDGPARTFDFERLCEKDVSWRQSGGYLKIGQDTSLTH